MSRRLAAGPRSCLAGRVTRQDQDREKRLAEALRANLRRRKEQARAAEKSEQPDHPDDRERKEDR